MSVACTGSQNKGEVDSWSMALLRDSEMALLSASGGVVTENSTRAVGLAQTSAAVTCTPRTPKRCLIVLLVMVTVSTEDGY